MEESEAANHLDTGMALNLLAEMSQLLDTILQERETNE